MQGSDCGGWGEQESSLPELLQGLLPRKAESTEASPIGCCCCTLYKMLPMHGAGAPTRHGHNPHIDLSAPSTGSFSSVVARRKVTEQHIQLFSSALTRLEGKAGNEMTRRKTPDALVSFSARYHSSGMGMSNGFL